MGIIFGHADYGHTGGAFLRGDICDPPLSQGDFSANGADRRVYRQFQRMRRIADQGIFIQDVFYFMVGDRVRLLHCGHDCTGRGLKFGLLERRSEEEIADVKRIGGTSDCYIGI